MVLGIEGERKLGHDMLFTRGFACFIGQPPYFHCGDEADYNRKEL
jgi:hypothetical protein